MRNRTALQVTAFGCGVLMLAACGSSSSKKNASNSTPAPSTSVPSSSTPAPSTSVPSSSTPGSAGATPSSSAPGSAGATAATATRLATVVLRAGDLPAGWKGTAYKADPADTANQAALLTCVGGRDTGPDKVAQANSQDYSLANATISSNAESFKTQADVDADVAILRSPKINACFNTEVRKQLATSLPAGAKILSANVTITPGAGGGASNVAGAGAGIVKISAAGQQIAVYFGVAFITGPLLEAEVDFVNVGYPIPAATRQAAIAKISARASAL